VLGEIEDDDEEFEVKEYDGLERMFDLECITPSSTSQDPNFIISGFEKEEGIQLNQLPSRTLAWILKLDRLLEKMSGEEAPKRDLSSDRANEKHHLGRMYKYLEMYVEAYGEDTAHAWRENVLKMLTQTSKAVMAMEKEPGLPEPGEGVPTGARKRSQSSSIPDIPTESVGDQDMQALPPASRLPAPNSTLALPPHTMKYGWMKKKGQYNKSWKTRFFVLTTSELLWFSSEPVLSDEAPKGRSGMWNSQSEADDSDGDKCQFIFLPAKGANVMQSMSGEVFDPRSEHSKSSRKLELEAPSEVERDHWINALKWCSSAPLAALKDAST